MAVTFVNEEHNDSAGAAGSTVVTLSPSPTAGNALVVIVAVDTATPPRVSTITDDASNTYIFRARQVGASRGIELWTCSSAAGTATALTVTMASAIRHNVSFLEYSGVSLISGVTKEYGATSI